MTADDELPAWEPDWQPLRRAFTDACWDTGVILPKQTEVALMAATIDHLNAESLELTHLEAAPLSTRLTTATNDREDNGP